MARKLYAAYTKAQKDSGFAARMGQDPELLSQANAPGALTPDGKFPRSSARGQLSSKWRSSSDKSRNRGMRNYIRDGQTSGKATRSFNQSVGAIPFKADPYRR